MRTTIDKAGRVVIPKALRERLGLAADTEVDIAETPEGLELRIVSPAPAVIVDDGGYAVVDVPGARETLAETLDIRDAVRSRGLANP